MTSRGTSTFCFGYLWQVLTLTLDVEGSVASGVLQAHLHRLVVIFCCADVPVAVGDRHEGADVQPGVVFVEEETHHVAV